MAEQQRRQASLIGLREARHVGMAGDVGRMLVIAAMRDAHADLMQARGPAEQREVVVAAFIGRIGKLCEQRHCRIAHAVRL
jgi:hypothetical protein